MGLLAASTLARCRKSVVMIERVQPRRPQTPHVHLISTDIIEQIDLLCPGFSIALAATGAPVADCNTLDADLPAAGIERCWPSRCQFDLALATAISPSVERVEADVQQIVRTGEGWQLLFGDGRMLSADRLIDASGRRRVSAGAIAQEIGQALPLDTGPRGGGYVSMLLENLSLPASAVGLRVRGDLRFPGLLLLREDPRHFRLTLQLPPGRPLPETTTAALALLNQHPDPRLHSALNHAVAAGPIHRFGAQSAEILDISVGCGSTADWLIMGDALAVTPPYLGRGIAQACWQARILDESLQADTSWLTTRQTLHDAMRDSWLEATTRDALAGLLPG